QRSSRAMAELTFPDDLTPTEVVRALDNREQHPIGTFSWLDLWQHQHSANFTVAKSAGYDILDDISAALDEALKNGETFEQFRDQLQPVLEAKGWWGKVPLIDPQTGRVIDA